MEIQLASVSVIHVSFSESEAQDFIIDAAPLQQRVYELLYPMNAKATKAPAPKSKRTPKAAARKSGKQSKPSSGTLICTTCGKAFKYRAYFNKHVALCVNAGTAAAS